MAKSVIEYALKVSDQATPTLRKAAASTDTLTAAEARETTAAASSAAAKQTQRMALLGYAAAAAAAVGAGAALIKSVVDSRNAIADASARTGVAASTIQGLALAFEGSGQTAEASEAFLKGYTNRLATVVAGSKEAAEAFTDLGVATEKTGGGLRASDAILRDTVAALQSIEDPTQRAAEATRVLGRQGGQLLQALGNADSLDAFTGMADTFGTQSGPRAASAAAEWQRATAALSLVLAGSADRLVDMVGGVEGMTGAIKGAAMGVIYAVELFKFFADGVWAALIPIRALGTAWLTLGSAMVLAAEGDFMAAGRALKFGVGDAIDSVADSISDLVLTPTRLADALGTASDRTSEFAKSLGQINAAAAGGGGGGGAPIPKITEQTKEATAEVVKATDAVDELAAALDELAGSGGDWLGDIDTGLRGIVDDFSRRFSATGSQFAGLLQGDPSQLIGRGVGVASEGIGGMLGGAGGAALGAAMSGGITAAIAGLAALGAAEGGGDAVAEQAVGYLDQIAAGIGQLDELIVGIAERLPGALLDVAVAILKGLPNILFALLIELPIAFMRGLVMWFRDVWEGIKAFFRGALNPLTKKNGERTALGKVADTLKEAVTFGQANTQTFNGSRDVGGLIPETGLYLMHRNEQVVRAPGSGPTPGTTRAAAGAAGMGGGASVVVNVTAPVADAAFAEFMGRELERLFGAGGLRTSTVIG